jgi:hypothetical protein
MNNTSAANRPTFNTASTMLSLHDTYSRVADIDLS